MEIKAVVTEVLSENPEFKISTVNIREPKEGEVRVKMVGTGICHTDVAYATDEFHLPLALPMVMGHEGSGIVESIGAGVTKVKPGDHVVIADPSCGHCKACKAGKPWLCEKKADMSILIGGKDAFGGSYLTTTDGKPIATMFSQGSFAEYVLTSERSITKIPDDMDLKIAGPLGCGLRTGSGAIKSTIKPQPGEWVIVNGGGTVGLSALWMGKAVGAKIAVVDIQDERLEMAKETGADAVINVRGMSEEEETKAIIDAMDGELAVGLVECSGYTPGIKAAMSAVGAGGRVAQIGVGGEITFDSWFFGPVNYKTITFIAMGDISNDDIIPELCTLYKEGKFPYDRLITTYKFEEIQQAMDDNMAGRNIKPVLLFED